MGRVGTEQELSSHKLKVTHNLASSPRRWATIVCEALSESNSALTVERHDTLWLMVERHDTDSRCAVSAKVLWIRLQTKILHV